MTAFQSLTTCLTLVLARGGCMPLEVEDGSDHAATETRRLEDFQTVDQPEHTVFEPTMPLQILVEAPSLSRVSVAGSGDIRARAATEHHIWEQPLSISILGSGDVDVEQLDVREVTVEIAGSGDIYVR